ncbi:MAG: hypothetical protein HY547_07435, partial [Elusimicrobia bacterium]|nr:hypothetical protein [Elusimicrobiota bacterium]
MGRAVNNLPSIALMGIVLCLTLKFPAQALHIISSATITETGAGDDRSYGIAVDTATNVAYFVGQTSTTATGADIWIGKYDSSLALLASATYNASGNGTDIGQDIAFDPTAGNIFVIGYAEESGPNTNIWLAKYNSSLVLQASATINGSANATDQGLGVTLDNSGNPIFTGFLTENFGGANFWTAKYNSSLVWQASATVKGNAGGNDFGYDAAVDSNGNIYVLGFLTQTSGSQNIWLAQYNSSLVIQTSVSINGSGNMNDAGYAISIDSNTNILTTGVVTETGGDANLWIARYNSSLILQASATVAGSGSSSDAGQGIASDGNSIFVHGYLNETAGGANIWTAKLGSNLAIVSSVSTNGSSNGTDDGRRLTYDGDQAIWAAGMVNNSSSGNDIWLGRFPIKPPSPSFSTNVSASAVSIIWNWIDASAETGYQVLTSTSGNLSGTLAANTTSWTETNLSTNTLYARSIISLDSDDISSATTASAYTLAASPGNAVSTFTLVAFTSMAITFDANTNPSGTAFTVEISTAGNFSVTSASSQTVLTTASLTGLLSN